MPLAEEEWIVTVRGGERRSFSYEPPGTVVKLDLIEFPNQSRKERESDGLPYDPLRLSPNEKRAKYSVKTSDAQNIENGRKEGR